MTLDDTATEAFIRANTAIESSPLVPELRLYLATEITPIWQATEAALEREGLAPPFWAFAWAGGQAIARYVLDHPEIVAGRRVLDFGAGGGLIAIATCLAGAKSCRAVDVDPTACAAARLNARLNDVKITADTSDIIGLPPDADIILVGDMCYEKPLAERMLRWLREAVADGITVLIGDPGRTYLPAAGLTELAAYDVPTSLELEDRTMRRAVVWRLAA